jgi:hypothetical protein
VTLVLPFGLPRAGLPSLRCTVIHVFKPEKGR